MPNPWSVGSARLLVHVGYEALATTSAGFAHTLGRPDGGVTRDEAIQHAKEIVRAVDLPVSADLEGGFGHTPEAVVETVRAAYEVGLAGCSIEDHTGNERDPIYELQLAVERVEAAVEAARSFESPFVLTARSENFLHGRPELDETVGRLQAFQEVGAEVLYAPGLPDIESMRVVVESVDRPVNLLADRRYSVSEMRETGAARISLGSHLSKAAFASLRHAAEEFLSDGTMRFAERSSGLNLDQMFSSLD